MSTTENLVYNLAYSFHSYHTYHLPHFHGSWQHLQCWWSSSDNIDELNNIHCPSIIWLLHMTIVMIYQMFPMPALQLPWESIPPLITSNVPNILVDTDSITSLISSNHPSIPNAIKQMSFPPKFATMQLFQTHLKASLSPNVTSFLIKVSATLPMVTI